MDDEQEINANTDENVQALVVAARHGIVHLLHALLLYGINPCIRPYNGIGFTALQEVIIRPPTYNHSICLNLMIPIALNQMIQAVLYQDIDWITWILSNGIHPDMYPPYSVFTIMQMAVHAGLHNSVCALIGYSDLETSVDDLNRTLLHLACISGSTNTVFFLWNGSVAVGEDNITSFALNINAVDDLGNTPLHYSILHGDDNMINFLVSSGGYNELRNANGQTAKQYAGERFHNGRMRNATAYTILIREERLRKRSFVSAFSRE